MKNKTTPFHQFIKDFNKDFYCNRDILTGKMLDVSPSSVIHRKLDNFDAKILNKS